MLLTGPISCPSKLMFGKYHLTYALYTEPGTRPVNEDSVGVAEKSGSACYILCDGLGGHGMGDTASSLAVEAMKEVFEKEAQTDCLDKAMWAAEERIMQEQKARGVRHKMKTTAVVLAADEKMAYIAHVGDSRLYVFSGNKVRTRTMDHSVPQMLVLSGEIKDSEIRHHPDRSSLLRVLGIDWDSPMFEKMAPLPLRKCQAFLLCSDGFWEWIEEEEMCRLLKESNGPREWLDKMVSVVMENGRGKEMDNNSAIAVWRE